MPTTNCRHHFTLHVWVYAYVWSWELLCMRVASRLTSGWIWCLMVWWNMDQLELLLQHNHNLGMIIITTILNTANHIPHWIMVVYVECREWYTGTCCHWISWVNPVPLMCLESLIKVWRSVCSLTYLIYLIIAFFETFGHCSDTRIIVYSLISRTMYHPSTLWHPQNHANIVTTVQVGKIYQLKTIIRSLLLEISKTVGNRKRKNPSLVALNKFTSDSDDWLHHPVAGIAAVQRIRITCISAAEFLSVNFWTLDK